MMASQTYYYHSHVPNKPSFDNTKDIIQPPPPEVSLNSMIKSNSENYSCPVNTKFGKNKGKRKNKTVYSAKTAANNDSKKRKYDNYEDEYTKIMRKEANRNFYREKAKAEKKAKRQRPIEIAKQDRYDLKFSPIFSSSLNKQPQMKKECPAMKVPLEIFVRIVEYATQETTLALLLTCKKWHNWLSDGRSSLINQAWRRSRKNTYARRRKPKSGICEMIYTIRKMKPKPDWYLECDMCFRKSNTVSWTFKSKLFKTCNNCKLMYEARTKQVRNELNVLDKNIKKMYLN